MKNISNEYLDSLTENQLIEKEQKLAEIIAKGEATIDQANKLNKIRYLLAQFANTRRGKGLW